jgi:hypothetical protein
MNEHKNLFIHIGEWWETHKRTSHITNKWAKWLPTPGNIIFSLLMVTLLIFTQSTWANTNVATNTAGSSATTINYQGRLANINGDPQNDDIGMSFTIWDAASGGNIIWGPENHSAVNVTDGLFNVGLGSQTSGGIPTTVWNGDRYLEITVGGETLAPRELIRSVPIAGMALTVPDGAIGTNQIQNGSITQSHAPTLLNSSQSNRRLVLLNRVVSINNNGVAYVNISDQSFSSLDAVVVSNGDMHHCNCYMGTYSDGNTVNQIQVWARHPDGSPVINMNVRVMLAIQGQY